MDDKKLRSPLRAARAFLGLNQNEVAHTLGIDAQVLARIESKPVDAIANTPPLQALYGRLVWFYWSHGVEVTPNGVRSI